MYVEGPTSYHEAIEALEAGGVVVVLPGVDEEIGGRAVSVVTLVEPSDRALEVFTAEARMKRAAAHVGFAAELRRTRGEELYPPC